jgi:hypothetical protein
MSEVTVSPPSIAGTRGAVMVRPAATKPGPKTAVYDRDLLDAALVFVSDGQSRYESAEALVAAFGEGVRRPERIEDFRRVVRAALRARDLLVRRNGLLTLTDAGRGRRRSVVLLGDLPAAIAYEAYPHERGADDLALKPIEQMLIAAIGSYDEALSLPAIADEYERRYGTRPTLEHLRVMLAPLLERHLLQRVAPPDGRDEERFFPSALGFRRLNAVLEVLTPRAMLAQVADRVVIDRQAESAPLLASSELPLRVREAVWAGVEVLGDELRRKAQYLGGGDGSVIQDLVDTATLPAMFREKYDALFLERLAQVVQDVGRKLRTRIGYQAESLAEALALDAILERAESWFRQREHDGEPSASEREKSELVRLESTLFQDRDHDLLFVDDTAGMRADALGEIAGMFDLSFAGFFEPWNDDDAR